MDFINKIFRNSPVKNIDFSGFNKINLPFPYIVINNGKVKYYNPMFKVEFKITTEESIDEFLESIDLKNNRQILEFNNIYYDIYITEQIHSINSEDKIILLIPQKNMTELNDSHKIVIGYIYIDNFGEVINNTEHTARPMVELVIDRKLNSIFKNFNALLQKYDKDKYLIITKYSEYLKMKSNEFKLIDEIKKVKVFNSIPITLSMGLGLNGSSIQETKLFANTAIDLALGRGGDQIILKNGDKYEMFGGNSDEIIVNNKVRARVKSNILKITDKNAKIFFRYCQYLC